MYAAGAPEIVLLNQALTEMGHHYGLPVLSCGFSSDAKELCMQSGLEGGTMAFCSMLAGADLLTGIGSGRGAAPLPAQALCSTPRLCARPGACERRLALDDEHVMLGLSATVGPGGHFLSSREPGPARRRAPLRRSCSCAGSFDAWAAQRSSEEARAAALVEDILATHRPKPLPDGAAQRLDEIVRAAAAEAGG